MGKSLVIVESPSKAKTINKYLGKEFVVKSSVGHVRDLPTSGGEKKPVDAKKRAAEAAKTRKMSPKQKIKHKAKKAKEQLIRRMGINPEKDWQANYQVLPGKEKVVKELKKLAKDADTVYLATDMDREGEAIAWHLREIIGGDEERFRRVIFNEITKSAIQAAFSEPAQLDMSRVNAQQARRFLDRVVGFMLSPLLWAKVARGLSAGRVQSVAVKLLVEREREIKAFIPEEYWDVVADVESADAHQLSLEVKKQAGKEFRPNSKESVDIALVAMKSADFIVSERSDRPTSAKPTAPYITSTLQQAASRRLGFSVKKTMMLAQRLYEAGYITYMRTDSTNLSQDAINASRQFIEETYGKKYLPAAPNLYGNKENAQEAHEAIRPSDVQLQSSHLTSLERDQQRLYELIWRQFVSCQMVPAKFKSSRLVVEAGEFELRATGRVMEFDGFQRVQPPATDKNKEAQILPDIAVGEKVSLKELKPSQHFTKPAPRYTEASLVKELEKCGIGRPSTYASIISTIQDRGYVRLENRRFYAEKMGQIVTDRLNENFDDLMDYDFTANMEQSLDDVAHGKRDWRELLNEFYADFSNKVEVAGSEETGSMRSNTTVEIDYACKTCSRPMQIRTASTGVFLGCSGYSLPPKERCKETLNLVSGDEVASVDDDVEGEAETRLLLDKKRCPICSTAMDSYLIDEKHKLHVCGNNPDCNGYEIEQGSFKIKGYEGPVLECDKCGSDMQLKSGRFGKYFGCTNSECKNTRKLLRNGEAAPPKMDPVQMPDLQCQKVDDHYVLRDGAAGMFLAASQFPKNRETRPPLLAEIMPYKEQIDQKYTFLFSGPLADQDGNPSQIRFSRKEKEQYLMTEEDGKATGWKAHYREGKWQQTQAAKKSVKKKPVKKVAKKAPKKAAK
jgi:DNA topoisomerase-1